MAHHRVQQWATFARQWWVYDARWQCPIKSAPVIIKHLQGKHKPIYHPMTDVGDHVVVINTKEIAMEDELWRTFKYFHHTGYPGGFSATRAYKVHDKDPTRIVPEEILENLSGQIRQVMTPPQRLDEYSPETRRDFPSLFDWPEDHVIDPGNKKPS